MTHMATRAITLFGVTMTHDTTIHLQVRDGIALLTLNRPDKRNAFNDAMRAEFIQALEHIAQEHTIRALVLTGAGKGFCAGGDVAGMQQRMQAPAGEIAFNGWRRQQSVHHATGLLHQMPKPVIAAVNGAAVGLGADTALACDFVLMSDEASFAWSYIARGLIPDGGGLYFLPRRIGLPQAKALIFSGRKVDAREAMTLGIADRVVAAENLLDEAHAWAVSLSQGSAKALALGKSILNCSFELTADQIFAMGSQAQSMCYTTTEHQASVTAFLARTAKDGQS